MSCNKIRTIVIKIKTISIYKLLSFKTMSKQIVYPEDITCIVEPTNGKGAIFIGNLEAAQNINTLQSSNTSI